MLQDSFLSFCIFRFSVRVTGPSAGKCSKHPTEIAREKEVARETAIAREIENSREGLREATENAREIGEKANEALGW